ncbi:MAG: hypothetical protein R3175_08395 [Marinobacter sp.]|uniref:hypothetical protein n=1 Tax=Marinobacter sp. TaxID=50741 RepID=UPI00299D538B|nr:hypothetical protein [Marinobacter sp.]MDX1756061.1 hypothetical protein [Marinobacter sp.]
MDPGSFLALFADDQLPLYVASGALLVALVLLILFNRFRSQSEANQEVQKQRLDTLWQELDDMRIGQMERPHHAAGPASDGLGREQLAIEKSAYDRLWPPVCDLHEKLGAFLRALESEEPANDSRLSARNAALEARTVLNQVRPFCHQRVEELATQLIDAEIKAHLAGCQYQEIQRDTRSDGGDHDLEVQHQKYRLLYDGEVPELMNELIDAIRRRVVRRGEGTGYS